MKITDLPPDRLTPLYDGTLGVRGLLTVTVSESSIGRDRVRSVPDCTASLAPDRGERARERGPIDRSGSSPVGRDGVPSVPDQSPDGQTGSVLDFVASDESLDRYHEIVSVSGWDLSNYQKNPVFQNAHQTGDIIHTLGKATLIEIRTVADRKAVAERIQFATDINSLAKVAYGLYRGKFLNAVSVGFVPSDWEMGNERTPYRRKFLKQELLEVSAVAIPANPNALALGYKSGAIEKSDLRDLSDLINLTLSAAPLSACGKDRVSSDGKDRVLSVPNQSVSPLLQLARDLHALFRK